MDKVRRTLISLLPSQRDLDLILASTNAWGLEQVFYATSNASPEQSNRQTVFDLKYISASSSVVIARTLLYLAICLQQLPPQFEAAQFDLSLSVDDTLHRYMNDVAELVTSNDDLACSIEGLECLLLQSLFYINDGNLRRAWLSGRHAVYIAQFLGLQKAFINFAREKNDDVEFAKRMMWHKAVSVDRYLALILGFPSGVGDDCFGSGENLEDARTTLLLLLQRKICIVSGSIIKRNQSGMESTYTATLEIDEKLDKLSKSMPEGWSNIPNLSIGRRSLEDIEAFDLVLSQMWYYQLVQMLHLPWMLRAFKNPKYEYSKLSCLRASREMLIRYLALRNTENTQLQARVVDFSTIIASVTLILNHVGSSLATNELHGTSQDRSDDDLVSKILESMRAIAHYHSEHMARQGVEVIQALLAVRDQNHVASQNNKLKLTIPFIGTIYITNNRKGNAPIQQHQLLPSVSTQSTCDLPEPQAASGLASDEVADSQDFDFAAQLSFEQLGLPSPSWFPSLESWDPENLGPFQFGESTSFWNDV